MAAAFPEDDNNIEMQDVDLEDDSEEEITSAQVSTPTLKPSNPTLQIISFISGLQKNSPGVAK